jgi:hypothetical protein
MKQTVDMTCIKYIAQIFTFYLAVILFSSCGPGADRKEEKKSMIEKPANNETGSRDTNPSPSNNYKGVDTPIKNVNAFLDRETLFVSKRSVIFYAPDSMQIVRRKREIGDRNFQIGLDDYAYYMNEAFELAEKSGISVVHTENQKFFKFIRNGQPGLIIRKDTLEELWGIFLFDPAKEPVKADMVEFEEELKRYFK